MTERKLKAWVRAGLIDGETAARIRDYEAAHARPLALWAVVGLAALAIGLGIISLVAANWDALVPQTRLALHGVLLGVLALVLWSIADDGGAKGRDRVSPALIDAALLVFALLGLAFFGHIGQVYQTSAPPWQAIALWLALFAPLLLGMGQGWASATLLVGGTITLAWLRADDPLLGTTFAHPGTGLIRSAAECAAPALFMPLAAFALRQHLAPRSSFWHRLSQIALAYVLAAISLLVIFSVFSSWASADSDGFIHTALLTLTPILGLAALLLWRIDRSPTGSANASILVLSALAAIAAYPLSGSAIGAGLLFLALWGGIAAAALHSANRALFQLATTLFALRLIILSFEATGGLLMSGLGLIIGGLLTLAIAWAAWHLSRALAPNGGARPSAGETP